MWPICPNCGNEQQEGMSACDSGFPDYYGGGICNDCGTCVMDDDWEYEDDDAFERDRKEDIERAGRMFQQDEIEDDSEFDKGFDDIPWPSAAPGEDELS